MQPKLGGIHGGSTVKLRVNFQLCGGLAPLTLKFVVHG